MAQPNLMSYTNEVLEAMSNDKDISKIKKPKNFEEILNMVPMLIQAIHTLD